MEREIRAMCGEDEMAKQEKLAREREKDENRDRYRECEIQKICARKRRER